jgi:flavin reductase (DIM6/NTAB) family NADH-FMN oxidoreductase RutF
MLTRHELRGSTLKRRTVARRRAFANDEASVERSLFRHACGFFPTGVTVVTRLLGSGQPHGVTVNSFTSVSLDPPLILVCIDRRSQFLRSLTYETAFAVNVLGRTQRDTSILFASPSGDRFADIPWLPGHAGVPLLAGAVASFECKVWLTQDAGDHSIVIGLVRNVVANSGPPLAYYRRDYYSLDSLTHDGVRLSPAQETLSGSRTPLESHED